MSPCAARAYTCCAILHVRRGVMGAGRANTCCAILHVTHAGYGAKHAPTPLSLVGRGAGGEGEE